MFAYEVMSEQEAMNERFQLLKEGEYEAVVTSSEDKTSSSGNPMMSMILSVFDADGRAHDVRDFLVFTKAMMWKVVHFADSANLLKDYQSGGLCSEAAINARLYVKIDIETGKEIPADKLNGKPLGSRYPDKNKVVDYIKSKEQIAGNNKIEEDVPF